MAKNNELSRLINISDNICELSIAADKVNFIICSLLGETEEATEETAKLIIYPHLVTFAEIALEYICKVNKTATIVTQQVDDYINILKEERQI